MERHRQSVILLLSLLIWKTESRGYNCFSSPNECGSVSERDPLLLLPIVALVTTAAAFGFGYCFFVAPFLAREDEWLDQEGVLVNAQVQDYKVHRCAHVLGVEYEFVTDTEKLWVYKKLQVTKQRYYTAVKTKQIRVAVLPPDHSMWSKSPSAKKTRMLAALALGVVLLITMTLALFSLLETHPL